MGQTLYKVVPAREWRSAQADHSWQGGPADLADGFIHLSTASQLPRTLARHFAGQSELILLSLDEEQLGGELRWDRAADGESWPHLYGLLRTADVMAATPIAVDQDGNIVPGG